MLSVATRELHGVFPEKIHHHDTENTCISGVILEYVSAGIVCVQAGVMQDVTSTDRQDDAIFSEVINAIFLT